MTVDWISLGSAVVGTCIGAFVSWRASRHYYVKGAQDFAAAAAELRAEADRIRRTLSVLGAAFENRAAEVRLQRDGADNITGATVEARGSAEVRLRAEGASSTLGPVSDDSDE